MLQDTLYTVKLNKLPSRRGRCEGGGEGRREGAESEGENERGRVGGVEAECAESKKA
jgi:hypothetical protein